MAKRIYRRNVSYNELSTKQLNSLAGKDMYFNKFSGLNTDKNYVNVDQESFSDVNNMYIDKEGRLSTRPPIIDSKFKGYNVQSVQILNGILFVIINNELWTDYGYKNDLYKIVESISPNAKVYWIQDKYVVFDTDNIFGLVLSKEDKSVTIIPSEELIYIPNSISDKDANGNIRKNIFTPNTAYSVLYKSPLSEETSPDDSDIDGKPVKFTMNDKEYSVVWKHGNWRTFITPIYKGEAISNVTHILFSKSGKYAICYNYKDVSDGFYYSSNFGSTFYRIDNPFNDVSARCICIAEDESGILYVGKWDNRKNYVYFSEMPEDGYTFNWENMSFDDIVNTYNCYNTGSTNSDYQYCYTKHYISSVGENRVAYCIDKNNWVICSGSNTYSTTTYYTNSPTDTTSSSSSNNNTNVPIQIVAKINSVRVGVLKYSDPWNSTGILQGSRESDVAPYKIDPITCKVKMSVIDDRAYFILQFYTGDSEGTIKNWYPSYSLFTATSDNGFAPGVRYGTHVGTSDRGIITSCGQDFDSDVRDSSVLSNDKWLDYLLIPNSSFTDIYISKIALRNKNLSSFSYYRRSIKVNGDYNSDHKSVVDLSKTSNEKRKLPYETFEHSDLDNSFSFNFSTYGGLPNYSKVSESSVLTDEGLYIVNGKTLVRYQTFESTIPLLLDGENFVCFDESEKILYSNGLAKEVLVTYNYLIPSFISEIVRNNFTLAIDNNIYQTEYVKGNSFSKLYIPEDSKVILEGEITNVIVFSEVSLGIFLKDKVYEYVYDSDVSSSLSVSTFRLRPTKLQLGCLKGSDIIHTYDGSTIIMTTKLGVAALNYQQFISSTEQVYNFLSSTIDDVYKEWSDNYRTPIKITLYKDYIIFYNTLDSKFLILDARNTSWWVWKVPFIVKQIFELYNQLMISDSFGRTYLFNMDNEKSCYDVNGSIIEWNFKTQKLHFGAPNNYKHLTRVSIITDKDYDKLIYELKFNNYRNLLGNSYDDCSMHKINSLTTIIERVSFIKTNAFQIEISSNELSKSPFIASAFIIHYRITEEIR